MWLIHIHWAPAVKNWYRKVHSHLWLIIFQHFPVKTRSMICSSFKLPLLADSRNWHTAANLFYLQQETYFRCQQNSGKPISTISWLVCHYQLFAEGAPLKWISLIFGLNRWTPIFLRFKERVPFKWKIKIPACKTKRIPFNWDHSQRLSVFVGH